LSKSFFYVGVRNQGAGQQIGAAVLAEIEEPNQQLKKNWLNFTRSSIRPWQRCKRKRQYFKTAV